MELEDLDLYDNRLKRVGDALDNLKKLKCVRTFYVVMRTTHIYLGFRSVLDLSFNNIKHVPACISLMENLKTVYFVQNKISHITGFGPSSQLLRSLELGGNKIRVRWFV